GHRRVVFLLRIVRGGHVAVAALDTEVARDVGHLEVALLVAARGAQDAVVRVRDRRRAFARVERRRSGARGRGRRGGRRGRGPEAGSPGVTVAELDRRLKRFVEGATARVRVEGEVVNAKEVASGHIYFALKDEREEALVECVMYRMAPPRSRRLVKDGARVV